MTRAIVDIKTLRPWITAQSSRSPGPGGQNVNKLNTRVTLLLNFEACPLLSAYIKARIRQRFATRMSRDGRLRVVRHRERTQGRNRRSAETQLVELLTAVMRPEKTRRATKPTRASIKRRLTEKRQRGELKQRRQAGREE